MKSLKNHIIAFIFLSPVIYHSPVLALDFFKNKEVIWQTSANEFIKYSDQDTSSFGKNDHPVVLDANEISTILGLIKYQDQDIESGATVIKPLFSAQQVARLGETIAKGLQNAQPDQDIIFAMEKSIDRFIGLKPDRLFISGRVFYTDNKLNMIIGDYDLPRNDAYEAAYDPTHTGIVRYHFAFGKRSKASAFNKPLIHLEGIESKQLNNTQRSDWLVIDMPATTQAYEKRTTVRQQEERAKKRKELIKVLGGEQPASTRKKSRSLEERLTELKQLRNKDLITDEDYAEKRKQLLNEL